MQQPELDAPAVVPETLKLVVAGGFGVGKTTFVGAVSEIPPLRTEELLTEAGSGTDSLEGVQSKTTTTVAMDFGRITFPGPEPLQLLLFGTPGQDRFQMFWPGLTAGAIGAVVLVDTRRLQDSFTALGHFEERGLPFVVAVNEFDDTHRYEPAEVRDALELSSDVPVMPCDARLADSCAGVLMTVTHYALDRSRSPQLLSGGFQ
ncbi:GTP-binding protein [Streptomyces sp. NPDC087532]|uniref:GTP-binding protein n=1 Tax=Streptomyces sp. NPDC087532 TaxID=3365795 RepID=UPI003823F0B0